MLKTIIFHSLIFCIFLTKGCFSIQELRDEKMISGLFRAFAEHPSLVKEVLEKAQQKNEFIQEIFESSDIKLDCLSSIDKSLEIIPLDQQQEVSGVDILNEVEFDAKNVTRIDFSSIPLGINCFEKLRPILEQKKQLYNLRTLTLSRFWMINDFIKNFFYFIPKDTKEILERPFVSLFSIQTQDSLGSILTAETLKIILDHFCHYTELVRDMKQRDFKTGEVAVFLKFYGITDSLLKVFNESSHGYEYLTGSNRLLVIRQEVNVYYRSGEEKQENIKFIAILNQS